MTDARLRHECLAEIIGTYVLVFVGVGSVHAAVLTGALSGIWQVAVVWGVAVALAIYATSALSGTHINPAITVAMTAFRGFPPRKAPWYIASQLVGAFLAAATLYALFSGTLMHFESVAGIVRGRGGSELSGMVYGEYFPNPATAGALHWTQDSVSLLQAMLAEGIGTAFLAFFVFAVTEVCNAGGLASKLQALFIGLAVSLVISVVAPLTQAGLNPMRDFAPRIVAYFAGWGSIAIPGPRGIDIWIYLLAPLIGGPVGAAIHQALRGGSVAVEEEFEVAA